MRYFAYSDGDPIPITKKQFDNLKFFIDNVLPPVARSFITEKRVKGVIHRSVVTWIYFDDIPILAFVRCY